MVPIIKGIGVLALGMLLPAVADAQEPAVEMQDYTSSIMVTTVDDATTVMQQAGAPLGMAVLTEGDNVMLQGLFAALTGIDGNTVGVGTIYSDKEDVALAYDPLLKALHISVPDGLPNCRVFVVDADGGLVCKSTVRDNVLDLSELAPGIYVAGLAADNKYSKTLKFIVK
ncbi:MAG: T9SS type A sorting domain-containing protein [Bacteroides sp.]|nr:T9SS type A sorting domain-containing protein [Bacteroides sp.]